MTSVLKRRGRRRFKAEEEEAMWPQGHSPEGCEGRTRATRIWERQGQILP